MSFTVKLQTDSILQVPLQNDTNIFTFIVNNDKFQTTKLIADLLSPKICKIHQTEATFNEYTITTSCQGNFQTILDLLNFETLVIKDSEISFVSEIIEKLGTVTIEAEITSPELNIDNVCDLLLRHEKSKVFYANQISSEINFVASHFFELGEAQTDSLSDLSEETVYLILNNANLSIENEDQLLFFVNKLYSKSELNSKFYEFVCFANVSSKTMNDFVQMIDIESLTCGAWRSLSMRLICDVETSSDNEQNTRYFKTKERTKVKRISYEDGKLGGIFKYLSKSSDINEEVNVRYSSHNGGMESILVDIENKMVNQFNTCDVQDSWICFEFKKCKVIPSGYTIKSSHFSSFHHHLKNWVIEGSVDNLSWTIIDQQNDCELLNGFNFVHTFSVQENVEPFKYIRIRQTGPNWAGRYFLQMSSIEFYGKIISN